MPALAIAELDKYLVELRYPHNTSDDVKSAFTIHDKNYNIITFGTN